MSAERRESRGIVPAAAMNAVLIALSAAMVVPFSWMLTVSLKQRRAVFSSQNFLPKIAIDASDLTDAMLLALLALSLLATFAILAYGRRPKGLRPWLRTSAISLAALLWVATLIRAFASGALYGPYFGAYSDIWSRIPFARMFINSLAVSVAVTALQLITSSLAGFAFSRLHFPGRDKLFWAYASLMMIPQQATMVPAFMLMHRLGLIDTYAGLILPFAAAPFGAFMMRQFFMGLPKEIEEAAALDGCSRFGTLWRVFVPLAKPALATLGLFSFMTSWNEFLWPLMVTTRRDMFTLQVGLDMLKWEAGSDWPIIMAASVLSTIPVVAAFLLAQEKFTRSIAMSGLNS